MRGLLQETAQRRFDEPTPPAVSMKESRTRGDETSGSMCYTALYEWFDNLWCMLCNRNALVLRTRAPFLLVDTCLHAGLCNIFSVRMVSWHLAFWRGRRRVGSCRFSAVVQASGGKTRDD